jgi:hypothetical protein
MQRRVPSAVRLLFVFLAAPLLLAAQALPSIADKTKGSDKRDGFFPLYWDAAAGKLWLEIPRLDAEFLYVVSLPRGMGSNDIGLDRAQLGQERIVQFQRVGPKVLLVQPNYAYRATSDHAAERRAVQESFARSVLWGFKVEAETDGRVLVDVTDFALRDAHGVIGTLRRTRQGDYRLDASRSALALDYTKSFPRNTEIEATLTFIGDNPGTWVRDVTPSGEAITVSERHSFVALPGPGYVPRPSDPRAGFFGIEYMDYATPLGQPVVKRFIARHRLEKRDPAARVSDPVRPIVYYLDPGAPEPVRTALLEGARWWNQAFEAAGYRNAFRVELLPDSADPMDVRYNVIVWVHRATRGWSYGSAVTDPRTGEIIKGHVNLGSLRVRQDYMIAEGLLSPYAQGTEDAAAARRMALARISQLSAHEVGHTLGIAHNYIASTVNRASVMDYPHPLATLGANGAVDLGAAYATGIGEWDKVAVTWGYQDFPDGTNEAAALERILTDARARNLAFLTDQDARPAGSAHPQTHLWDNGSDAAAELQRVMDVRRAALARFGEQAIKRGAPLATLEETLVPLYLHHRYQVEAAVKVVGGVEYTYALRGDGQTALRVVPAAVQVRALDAVLATLAPGALALPRAVLALIPPRPYTFERHRELFGRWTGLTFDAVAPAAAAADLSVSLLLNDERAARLVQQHALDSGLPGLETVIDRLVAATFGATPSDAYHAEVARVVQRVVVENLQRLAGEAAMPQVRAMAVLKLRQLGERATAAAGQGDEAQRAHTALLAADIERYLDRDWQAPQRGTAPAIPPGAPIGDWEP